MQKQYFFRNRIMDTCWNRIMYIGMIIPKIELKKKTSQDVFF